MKINMPVTNHEVTFSEQEFMLTRTNMKGVITYANQDFIKVSGFSEAELVGSSHNIVRHPDMPPEAFADLWHNLKQGKPWTGMVKNRTKTGDFYWVEANAAPIFENGQVVGFLSARKKPTREQIEAADAAYRLFKEGKAKGLAIVEGKVVRDNWWYKTKTKLNNLSVAQRLYGTSAVAVVIATALVLFGLQNLAGVNASFKTVYEDRMIPTADLGKISNALLDIEAQTFNVAGEVVEVVGKNGAKTRVLDKTVVAEVRPRIEHNLARMDTLWKKYLATYLTPEEKILAAKFETSQQKFIAEFVRPALAAIGRLDAETTMRYADAMPDAYKLVNSDLDNLLKLQEDVAAAEYQNSVKALETNRMVSFGVLAAAVALLVWLGMLVIRSITQPLNQAIDVFNKISSGKLDTSIEVQGDSELAQVLHALKITQTGLSVSINAQKENAEREHDAVVKYENQLAAIAKSTGVVEFDMHGNILTANDIFLKVMGYSAEEAIGKHHRTFVDAAYANSEEYKQFWAKMNTGKGCSAEFRRFGKDGNEVWLQAGYNPILDAHGVPYKVVKYATDITEQKLRNADFEGQMAAIGKSQGIIELALDGTILKVNENYCKMLGYTPQELLGKHVSMVLDSNFAKSAAYTTLWNKLISGGTDAGQYKRIAKNGSDVWIQASYNPIYDLNGEPCKIVNYTIDITKEKLQAADYEGQISAINKIQGVVEFDLTGKITSVNDAFTAVVGYSKDEIIGKHHGMFVDASYRNSSEYKAFWEMLGKGHAIIEQFKRLGKGGNEIWLQASYNPILDLNGKAYKVVKYATDITAQHHATHALEIAVEETRNVIQAAKSGDLRERVSLEGKNGAIANLCDGVNCLMDKMTEMVTQVREAGETINTAAGEIATGNNDLSARTEQQASSLEKTASSMGQLASTVRQNADNAKQANQLAAAASGVAIKGGEAVGQVVGTMSAINESAKKIEDIISVIDGIAFQTNILALNAAVEAARAGEQGRGFAVVAGEVRNLAQRSSSAAKEIKELITDSVSKTAEGTTQVENAGRTMEEIVASVKRVTDIMGEIASASAEQSTGIGQVNDAIASMDEVTQQNAALVEEAAAAAESLVEQASSLMDTVNQFRLSGSNNATQSERRATQSPMRAASRPAAKPQATAAKVVAKTGTDDEWEEF